MSRKFTVGERIRVCGRTSYNGHYYGEIGIVKGIYNANVAVELDFFHNSASSYGYFYFKPLELTKYMEDTMENNKKVFMEDNYSVAIVAYNVNDFIQELIDASGMVEAHKKHSYACACFDGTIEAGDVVVFSNASSTFTGVGFVVGFDDKNTPVDKEIIAKVDLTEYRKRVYTRERLAELKQKMQARAEHLKDTALFEMLAANDTEMRTLLEEYKGIIK